MRQPLPDEEEIRMRRGTFVLIWELLDRTLRNSETRKKLASGKYEVLFIVDEAERRALHFLAGAIESAIPEIWTGEMEDLIAKEKHRIESLPK